MRDVLVFSRTLKAAAVVNRTTNHMDVYEVWALISHGWARRDRRREVLVVWTRSKKIKWLWTRASTWAVPPIILSSLVVLLLILVVLTGQRRRRR